VIGDQGQGKQKAESRKAKLRVSDGEWRSRIDQAFSRRGDFQNVFLGRFDPQADGSLSLA
jgi:hypothetical protein